MNEFSIKILPNSIIQSSDYDICIREIQIGDFKETFEMPLEYWTIYDYEKQWQEGIERIRTHDQSCLVYEIQDPAKAPWANN